MFTDVSQLLGTEQTNDSNKSLTFLMFSIVSETLETFPNASKHFHQRMFIIVWKRCQTPVWEQSIYWWDSSLRHVNITVDKKPRQRASPTGSHIIDTCFFTNTVNCRWGQTSLQISRRSVATCARALKKSTASLWRTLASRFPEETLMVAWQVCTGKVREGLSRKEIISD